MTARKPPAEPPLCPYCGKPAEFLATSEKLYSGRDFGAAWVCWCCGAWVGCHKGTRTAKGRLADATLRPLKIAAHAALDPLWRRKMAKDGCNQNEARSKAYAWLARQMGLTMEETHIGMFNEAQCQRVIEICRPYQKGNTNG